MRRQTYEKAVEVSKDLPAEEPTGFVAPARYAHVDQSYTGALEVLEDNLPLEAYIRSQTRWGIINVWRPIKSITREPFAACDARTVEDEDLVGRRTMLPKKGSGTYDGISRGESFEVWIAKASPKHQWWYQSHMTPGEVMFVKCFDSKKDGRARRSPHSAFVDPKTKDVREPRESIETRCLVFWEDQEVE